MIFQAGLTSHYETFQNIKPALQNHVTKNI